MPNDNKLVTLEDLKEAIDAKAGVTSVNNQTGAVSITPANIGAVSTTDVIDIPHGGTGATTAAVTITNDYTSVLDVINAIKGSRIFPISIQKNGGSTYYDMPTGYEAYEWNMELVGDSTRLTAFLFVYGNTGVYKRDFVSGSWLTGWIKITNITPADIGAVAKSGDTMTGPLKWANGTALPAASNLQYFLGIDAFADGGTTHWIRAADLRTSIGAVSTSAVIDIAHGGTGATTSAVTITNNYSSVLNAINAVKGTRIFPISIQKNGSASYTDMPSGFETHEWNLLLFGDVARMTALLHIYQTSSLYLRNFFGGNWITSWTQLH